MKLKFCGATKQVTGSCYLLEVNGYQILFDCGLFQGSKSSGAKDLNKEFLFDAKKLDAVVLTHAHIDHSGRLPLLIAQGYSGPIHCTIPTIDICQILLLDSANLQKQDADYKRKHFKEQIDPLYSVADVFETIKQFVGHEYQQTFEVVPGVKITFFDAGHVFGSAQILVEIKGEKNIYKLVFSGDYGRKYMPILNNPYQITNADILVTESTYASHLHDSFSYVFDEMKWVINDVYNRGGKIFIPGFSLERTQELIYVLHKLYLDKQIPALPIFVDSPMATKISKVFMKYVSYYDDQSFKDFLGRAQSPFSWNNLKYISTRTESKKLNSFRGPCIIIAGSGMCTGGRILHHLRYGVSDPKNLILVVGFMASNTLGRRLVEGKRKVKIFGEYHDLKADVVILNEFSGHADKLELLENIGNIRGLNQIFITHGEELETSVLRDNIYNILNFKGRVDIPDLGEEFLIEKGNVQSKFAQKNARDWKAWQENRDVESF